MIVSIEAFEQTGHGICKSSIASNSVPGRLVKSWLQDASMTICLNRKIAFPLTCIAAALMILNFRAHHILCQYVVDIE